MWKKLRDKINGFYLNPKNKESLSLYVSVGTSCNPFLFKEN
jgi:hypothetical protein